MLSDSQDLLVTPAYFEKRGFGIGATYRYVRREGSRGQLDGFYLHDTEESPDYDPDRWVVSIRHEEIFTPRLILKVDVARVSDNTFLEDFGNTLDERSRQRLESNVSLSQRWEKWNFVGRFFFYQDLTTEEPIELNRLPDLRLNAFQQPILGLPDRFGLPDLLFDMESSYVNFVREVGSEGQRLDVAPRLLYPWSPGGFFTLTPRLGLRETLYDTEVVGTKVDRGFIVEDTRKEFTVRSLFEAGADLDARAFRVFEAGGALGIQKMQHVIEPRVSYNFLDGDDSRNLPQWDGIDTITPGHTVTYSLTNRLKARAVGEEDRPGRVWELIRLTLSQTYTIDPEPFEASLIGTTAPLPPPIPTLPARRRTLAQETEPKRLSDFFADLILEPIYGVRFRGTASFDPYESRVTSATTDFIYEAERWRAAFGTRHVDEGALTFIQAALEARLGARWAVRLSSDYNVDTGTVIENRIEVDFREQCWGITAAFIDRTDEDEFRITVNLLELGQYAFGRAFAGGAGFQ